jgi:predicted transcriptional regulator
MSKVDERNLHVTLPDELDAELKDQARRLGTTATAIAREAIEEWVARQKRERVAQEIRAYADAMAGTRVDLDEAFEAGGVHDWLRRYA